MSGQAYVATFMFCKILLHCISFTPSNRTSCVVAKTFCCGKKRLLGICFVRKINQIILKCLKPTMVTGFWIDFLKNCINFIYIYDWVKVSNKICRKHPDNTPIILFPVLLRACKHSTFEAWFPKIHVFHKAFSIFCVNFFVISDVSHIDLNLIWVSDFYY